MRVLPELDRYNRPFWQGGAEGKLTFQNCRDCEAYIHPPGPVCPRCFGDRLEFKSVSGRAEVLSYTLNYQPWQPDMSLPLAIAIVSIDEQANVRLTTNIVGCEAQQVHIGMKVEVTFEQVEDVWLPLFRPVP